MKTTDLHWLAGLLEGEGNFRVNRKRYPQVLIQIVSTDRDVMVKAAAILGVRVRGPYGNGPGRKEFYGVSVQHQQTVGGWMMTLYPLMHSRRRVQIHECLAAWRAL